MLGSGFGRTIITDVPFLHKAIFITSTTKGREWKGLISGAYIQNKGDCCKTPKHNFFAQVLWQNTTTTAFPVSSVLIRMHKKAGFFSPNSINAPRNRADVNYVQLYLSVFAIIFAKSTLLWTHRASGQSLLYYILSKCGLEWGLLPPINMYIS